MTLCLGAVGEGELASMTPINLKIPTRFWAFAPNSRACSFPATGHTRGVALAGVVALAVLALLPAPAALPLAVAAFAAPFAMRSRRQRRLLETAIANMWQGLALFDGEGHLVLYNPQFCQMLGLSPEATRRAKTHRDILRMSVEAGNHEGLSFDDVWRADSAFVARRQAALAYVSLPGRRTIAESHMPTSDGGWVRTYADVTGRREVEARIIHIAHHDVLTDLPNRMFFHEELRRALRDASEARPIALVFLDLDRFKEVNDSLGHAAGDQLLRLVAARLRDLARDGGMIARLGGDEFAILQTKFEHPGQVRELAERLVAAVGEAYEIEGSIVSVGVSVGVALAPFDGSEIDGLSKRADIALYRAKSEGRGGYRFFAEEREASAPECGESAAFNASSPPPAARSEVRAVA
jgi:diguanylate cyclase (GGDEF)-like protein